MEVVSRVAGETIDPHASWVEEVLVVKGFWPGVSVCWKKDRVYCLECLRQYTEEANAIHRDATLVRPYLLRLLEFTWNYSKISSRLERNVLIPIYTGGYEQETENYRLVSLTSVVCKYKYITAEYLKWESDIGNWLFCSQHDIRWGYFGEVNGFFFSTILQLHLVGDTESMRS